MLNVLVVDDSVVIRKMLQKSLEGLGHKVLAAKDGVEALNVLGTMDRCDIVLTDWHMPQMDGIELVRAIRSDARYARLPVLMITSESMIESVTGALEAGVNDFLMKPFTPVTLSERITEIMGG